MSSSKKNGKGSPSQLVGRVEKSIKLLAKVVATLGDFSTELTTSDKKRIAKARPNFATVIPTIGSIASRYGVVVPKHSVGKMNADLATWNTLKPLRDSVALLLKKIDDAMLVASGDAWSSATAFYTVLRRVSDGGDDIAALLQPYADYFAKSAKRPNAKPAANGAAASVSPNGSSTAKSGASALIS
jgi:hypothetical protein